MYVNSTADLNLGARLDVLGSMHDPTHIACARDVVYVDVVDWYEAGEAW